MGGNSKQEFLDAIRPRYLKASKEEKGVILRGLLLSVSTIVNTLFDF